MGCFGWAQFGKRMVIAYYSGALMYANLYGYKNLDKIYGNRLRSVDVKELQRYAVHISNDAKHSGGRSHHA